MKRKIVVGVSGGVDSAACVLMLKEAGYEVVGVMLSMCGNEDERTADELSDALGVKVLWRDVRTSFEQRVIEPFIAGLLAGVTPSPCTVCNPEVKWRELVRTARQIGADRWATGHYCRVVEHDGRRYVARGADALKDQSYYLWRLDDDILSGAVMPLGDSIKSRVKDMVAASGLGSIASGRESMSVCFFGGGGYGHLLRQRCDVEALRGGDVRDMTGRVVATHEGFPFYTIGQRKGLDIPRGMCVVHIDAARNTLYIGAPDSLYCQTIRLRDVVVRNDDELFGSDRLRVVVRGIGRNPEGVAQARPCDGGIEVRLESPGAWAVCKGQPAVFYIDDRVVGGGVMC